MNRANRRRALNGPTSSKTGSVDFREKQILQFLAKDPWDPFSSGRSSVEED